MLKKPQIVALSKMDIADESDRKKLKKIKFGRGVQVVPISSVAGDGLKELADLMWKKLKAAKED